MCGRHEAWMIPKDLFAKRAEICVILLAQAIALLITVQ